MAGDKGYISRKARGELRRRIGPGIPRKKYERRDGGSTARRTGGAPRSGG